MRAVENTGRTIFVLASILLSVFLTYLACLQSLPIYKASLQFQIATDSAHAKANLGREVSLLTSDALLMQVLKDVNLLPEVKSSRFRSFDLGPNFKPNQAEQVSTQVQQFKSNLDVRSYPENAVILIQYKSFDGNEAQKIVETVFEKFKNWRKSTSSPEFDNKVVDADKNLALKREAFLQSQKDFLDFMEAQGKTPNALDAKKTELAAQIESLRLRYGPKHPVLREALRQQEILNKAPVEIPNQEKIQSLRQKMDDDFKALDIAIRQSVLLEQEKSKSGSGFEILPLGDVKVEAVPQYIVYKLAAAALLALILSLLYIRLRSTINPTFNTSQELERAFTFRVLGKIPNLLRKNNKEVPIPSGATSDALKTLRQELKLASPENPLKLITVTSTNVDEGRSELVISLGRMAARASENVMIIDADLRSPTFPNRIPLKIQRNLVDYLSGQARLEDIIDRTDPSGAHVIYGASIPNTALDIISSEKMKTLLHSLQEVYDLVLVQAPVSPRGPDARVLSSLSDHTLYLVESGKTSRKDVRDGIAPFITGSAQSVTFVLVN